RRSGYRRCATSLISPDQSAPARSGRGAGEAEGAVAEAVRQGACPQPHPPRAESIIVDRGRAGALAILCEGSDLVRAPSTSYPGASGVGALTGAPFIQRRAGYSASWVQVCRWLQSRSLDDALQGTHEDAS